MTVEPGNIVLLIGTFGAGKSAVLQELPGFMDVPYLFLGPDAFRPILPPQWRDGKGQFVGYEGFRFERVEGSERPATVVRYGEAGERALRGMHRAVAALSRSGNNVVIEETLLDEAMLDDWYEALEGLPALLVRLWAPLEVLEAREREQGKEPGLARGHFSINQSIVYDLDLNTSAMNPYHCAKLIAGALSGPYAILSPMPGTKPAPRDH